MGMNLRVLTLLLVAPCLWGCVAPEATLTFQPTAKETQFADLMADRLVLAGQVAWVKFQNNLSIYDPKRETELLASLVRQGSEMGIPSQAVEVFFRAQFQASREVQAGLIGGWKNGDPLPAFPPWDLRRHIRPKLDRISAGLLGGLKDRTSLQRPGFAAYADRVIRQRGLSRLAARQATAPLRRKL